MAISFPSNPTTNQTYTYGNKVWTFNGTRWISTGASYTSSTPVVPITVSTTSPGATTEGSLWVDSASGTLSVYVGGAWVLASAGVLNTSANSIPGNSIVDSSITASKLAPGAAVPDQTGQTGKFLTTDGNSASWASATPADGSITPAMLGFGTSAITLASGNTAQRPQSPVPGMVRYNSETGFAEVYSSAGWGTFGATPPTINSVSPTTFGGNANTTFTISGTNFTSDASVYFITNDNTPYQAGTVVFVSSSTLTAKTPQDFTVAQGPLSVKVSQAAGETTKLNSIDTGGSPVWTTASGSLATITDRSNAYPNLATLVATDPDAGSTITYTVTSGSLPGGFTLNSSSGVISGTATDVVANTTSSFTVAATDEAGNQATRTFSVTVNLYADGSSATRAAPTAQAIKTLTGTTTSGNYWIKPPGQTAVELYCDMSTSNKGWALIAAGRESTTWWSNAGAGDTSTLVQANLSSTSVRYMSQAWIQAYTGGTTWGNMSTGLYIKRIEVADSYLLSGTSPTFTWTDWDATPAAISLNMTRYPSTNLTGTASYTGTNTTGWTDTTNIGAGNDSSRFFSWTWSNHGGMKGVSAGNSVYTGYQSGGEGHAIQTINIFIN